MDLLQALDQVRQYDPLAAFFSSEKSTFGLPAEANVLAGLLVGLMVVMVVQTVIFSAMFKGGVLLRTMGGAVVAFSVAATVFFFLTLMQGLVSFALALLRQPNVTLDLAEFFSHIGAGALVGVVASSVTFVLFGKALAEAYA